MLRKCAGVTSERKYRLTHLCESGMTHSPRWALHPSAHSPQQLGTIVFIFDSINLTLLTCHQHFIPSPLSLSLSLPSSSLYSSHGNWVSSTLGCRVCIKSQFLVHTERCTYTLTHTESDYILNTARRCAAKKWEAYACSIFMLLPFDWLALWMKTNNKGGEENSSLLLFFFACYLLTRLHKWI